MTTSPVGEWTSLPTPERRNRSHGCVTFDDQQPGYQPTSFYHQPRPSRRQTGEREWTKHRSPACFNNNNQSIRSHRSARTVEAGTMHPIHVLLLTNCAISACAPDMEDQSALHI